MPSLRKITSPGEVISLREFLDFPSENAAQETYYFEDGWVFREHHGKYIECICRVEDARRNGISVPRSQRDTANRRPA